MVLSMRMANREGEEGAMECCRRLLRGEQARGWVGGNFRIGVQRPEFAEALEGAFDERKLVHAGWKHPFLYGFQELKRVARRPIDLEACLCRAADEAGIELVHHYSAGEPARFWPCRGRFFRPGKSI